MLTTDEYQPNHDDPSFTRLIQAGVVLDSTGKVPLIEDVSYTNPQDAMFVKSGLGYYDVWKSNLQKAIRRGDERSALKSLVEIVEMSLDPKAPIMFASNILNRAFQVVVSEDIGWAEPLLPHYADTILSKYYVNKTILRHPDYQTEILRGIQVLVRCHKSRYVDYLYHYACNHCHIGQVTGTSILEQLKNPKLDLETKTILLITLYRSTEQVKMPPSVDVRLSRRRKIVFLAWHYLLTASPYRGIRKQVNSLLNLYLLPGGESILTLIHALVLVTRSLDLIWSDLPQVTTTPSWEEVKSWPIFPLAVSYDKHTLVGKILGRDEKWFYRYGGKISHPVPEYRQVELSLFQHIQH